MFKSYIWSLPTRVFHWLFTLLFVLAFLSDDEKWLNYHAFFGYAILILLVFRFFWGYLGPKYSKFKDFPFGIANLKEFFLGMFNIKQKYIGHNPAASYVMMAMFITIFLVIITGALTFGIQEGKGVFSFLNNSLFKKMELFEDIHEFLANATLFLIAAHIGGVLSDKLLHGKYETLNSIFTGFKKTDEQEGIKLGFFQKFLALFFAIFLIAFLLYSVMAPKNIFIASKFTPTDYTLENKLFVKECASCHILYPPEILPQHSWVALMSNLSDHFGDDASIEEDEHQNILNYLVENSSEHSSKKFSFKIANSIGNNDIIAVTKSKYWEKKHKKISKEVFLHKEVKSKANCKACHENIEKGLIENDKIKDINAFL